LKNSGLQQSNVFKGTNHKYHQTCCCRSITTVSCIHAIVHCKVYQEGLFQSFIKNNKNNVYKASQSGSQFTLEYGSKIPYAKIHEVGGFINAIKRASSVKRKKETYVMAQFFWRKYMETKAPFFKRIALSIENKGGVNIKARPYWKPAIEDFKRNGQPKFEKQMKQAIVQGIIELQNRTRN